ncbi:tRNA1(Val) (adenine(37)-N6)-methyltransferase [Shouchella shacheensis]|uniref:tRNA1(Val) (adenine(37)-N6)-methyltransferase n=1 Tax=Shouchella shacheensis TaxID=1649580 RepID=UPI00073FADE5|nr:tRNA1(Val) (adenine(37)-N6)-methyltransferase [Shouchella shacheensis]
MELEIQTGERMDFIAGTKMPIIQSETVFSYSIDAILLGRFAHVPIQKGRLLDLCSGNGVVGLVLATRSKGHIAMVELQQRLHEMALRSVKGNGLEARVRAVRGDVRCLPDDLSGGRFDLVTCNPPYFPLREGVQRSENEHKALARHEIACTLEDVIRAGSFSLKHGGKLALVQRPERLAEMITLMRAYHLEPKRLQFVHPAKGKESNMVLLEGTKGGNAGLRTQAPLIVYTEEGAYTSEFQKVYLCQ